MKIFDHGIGFFLIYLTLVAAAYLAHGMDGETPKNAPQSQVEVTRTA